MVLQNDMPLSGVITMSLKGEERELHERDLLSYVENLSRGGKEVLQQALKEVETAITGWNDSYFISTYEKEVGFVGEKDWEYKKIFEISEAELDCDDVLLNCKMLDTICDVYVNSRLLFVGQNCFVAYSKSVKSFLNLGENEIRIVFKSPVNYVRDKYKKCPTPINSNGQNGCSYPQAAEPFWLGLGSGFAAFRYNQGY